ncbi:MULTISPECIES: YwbE family protein [unclassified Methanoregula]|uniref:YwbE family protein n=1 Tax=unclassified Methanoregula TaxID=2649730 RepID=UPI0025FF924F|nr:MULTISPECIES: YwbE family protein [unclassified Methanoregula]
MADGRSGKRRDAIRPGLLVDIVQKSDQRSGKLTRGRVKEILTGSATHPHGIKVRLEDGRVGRVAAIVVDSWSKESEERH